MDVKGILEAARDCKKSFVVLSESSYLAVLTAVAVKATDRLACCHCRQDGVEVARSEKVQDEDFPISLVGATLLGDFGTTPARSNDYQEKEGRKDRNEIRSSVFYICTCLFMYSDYS